MAIGVPLVCLGESFWCVSVWFSFVCIAFEALFSTVPK